VGERRWKTAPNEQVQPSKTLWDWLQLLIVPAILIGVTFLWSASQTRSDSRREDRRIAADRVAAEQVRRDTTLSDYFQRMSDLMLNKRLLSSKPRDAVRSVARTVTLTTLRRLDGGRKGEVVRFLEEARLIDGSGSLVRLAGANLTFAFLTDADLTDANLTRAYLTRGDLTRGDLTRAKLTGADLRGANLRGANLTRAFLTDADLTSAFLTDAFLTGADLKGAKGLP
jgi:uncharacterized protein YjbI with pentapeptide repeats